MSKKRTDYFWLSYSDLMTSLFFVMLVLFILVFSVMRYQQGILIERIEEYEKIEEIKLAISSIDTSYFKYNSKYKKHVLNIEVQFANQSSNILDIPQKTRNSLVKAGKLILSLIKKLPKKENINYLVIVEGQASKDNWWGNDELSYKRALALKKLWANNNINFENIKNCELIIAGSGQRGVPRLQPDKPPKNQRFLIHIIPKVGKINYKDEK